MAIHHHTYLDLPIAKRKAAANRVREQIRSALTNPFLAADQKAILVYQLDRIHQWQEGKLPVGEPFKLPRTVTAICMV